MDPSSSRTVPPRDGPRPRTGAGRPGRPRSLATHQPPRADRIPSGGGRGSRARGHQDVHRWVGDDGDLVALERIEDVHHRTCEAAGGWRPRERGRRTAADDGGRRAGGSPRREVTSLLARETRHDDAAHAHGSGAGQRLGVDARADFEIRPARPTSTEPSCSPSTQVATCSCPRVGPPSVTIAQPAPGRPDQYRAARSHIPDDAGDRAVERSVTSADATRQRPRQSNRSSPSGMRPPGAGSEVAGRRRPSCVDRGRVRRSGAPGTTVSPAATRRDRPGPGNVTSIGPSRRRRLRTSPRWRRASAGKVSGPGVRSPAGRASGDASGAAVHLVGHPSDPAQSDGARRRAGRAAGRPVGQPQRDVAEVDHQSAEAARDVDGEVSPAPTEPDAFAELELRHGGRARRQVDQLETARGQLSSLVPSRRGRRRSRSTGPRSRPA